MSGNHNKYCSANQPDIVQRLRVKKPFHGDVQEAASEIELQRKRIAVLENDAKYEGDENERRTLRFRAEIQDMCKERANLKDQNRWLTEKMADLDIANAALRDEIAEVKAGWKECTAANRERITEIQFLKNQQDVLVTALDRIANMKNRDGIEIEMHRDELRAIAKTALGRK